MPSRVPGRDEPDHKDVQVGIGVGIPQMDVDYAAHRIGQTFPGRIPVLAQLMGVNADTLSKKLNPNCETHNLSVGEATHLQSASRRYDILYAMAASLDHVAHPVECSDPKRISDRLTRVGAEVGDVFRVAQTALADGSLSPRERKQLANEITEAVAALNALLQVL